MINLCDKCIVVTGGAGFLGTAVIKALIGRGVSRQQIHVPRSSEYNLVNEQDVIRMYQDFNPEVVIHLAAEVGGIGANMAQPGRFFYSNMAMGMHLVEHARLRHLEKFIHTGTVCAYPKYCEIPFQEQDIWNGYPEETNAPYGVAKKALFVMLDGYQRQYGLKSSVVVPVNLYGPNDNFNPASSHVIPALIRKCMDAKREGKKDITCWGTGSATRQFLFVEDAAEAIVRAAEMVDTPEPIVAQVCDFDGSILWDASKPDGQPRRSIDIARAKDRLAWQPEVSFSEGLQRTVDWYCRTQATELFHSIDSYSDRLVA